MKKHVLVEHSFGPLIKKDARILILGSMPSPASRAVSFYYGHPQNRFWKMLALIYKREEFKSIEEKKAFCLKNKLALFDVIARCEIVGASDASIRNVTPNDIAGLIKGTAIRRIILNGNKAALLFQRYIKVPSTVEVVSLPSTSAANASMTLAKLCDRWRAYLLS